MTKQSLQPLDFSCTLSLFLQPPFESAR